MDKDKTVGDGGQTGERQKYSLLKGRDVNIKHEEPVMEGVSNPRETLKLSG